MQGGAAVKRALALLLCAGLLMGLLSGCKEDDTTYVPTGDGLDSAETQSPTQNQGGNAEDETAQVALAYDPDASLNPFKSTGNTNRSLFSLIYQGLFTVDRNYEARPMLCQSYNVSADRKTYTFYMADAYFSDGTAVTAADVVASLKASQGSPWYGGRLQHVESISSYGDAVVLELDTPINDLPILLDIPVVKASEVNSAHPLGTGPYRLDGTQLRRQAAWWCSTDLPVTCDTVELIAARSIPEIRDAFEFSNVSLVYTDPASQDYVDFHSDYELWDCENGLFLYLVCNSESEFFSDSDIRCALTHAIDREGLVSAYYNGFAYSASVPASPQSPYYSETLADDYAFAPEKFREALLDAGVIKETTSEETDEEDTVTVTKVELTLLLSNSDPIRVKVGKDIAAQLEAFGLNVTIVEASGDEFTKLLKKGEYDLYLAQTRLSANMDLTAFFGTKTALNYGGLADPSCYAICLEALSDPDNYYTLHEMVMNNGWLCPILFQTNAIYTQRGVFANFEPARDNLFYYDLGTTLADALISE